MPPTERGQHLQPSAHFHRDPVSIGKWLSCCTPFSRANELAPLVAPQTQTANIMATNKNTAHTFKCAGRDTIHATAGLIVDVRLHPNKSRCCFSLVGGYTSMLTLAPGQLAAPRDDRRKANKTGREIWPEHTHARSNKPNKNIRTQSQFGLLCVISALAQVSASASSSEPRLARSYTKISAPFDGKARFESISAPHLPSVGLCARKVNDARRGDKTRRFHGLRMVVLFSSSRSTSASRQFSSPPLRQHTSCRCRC